MSDTPTAPTEQYENLGRAAFMADRKAESASSEAERRKWAEVAESCRWAVSRLHVGASLTAEHARLREALAGLVGSSDPVELKAMRIVCAVAPDEDAKVMTLAIDALLAALTRTRLRCNLDVTRFWDDL